MRSHDCSLEPRPSEGGRAGSARSPGGAAGPPAKGPRGDRRPSRLWAAGCARRAGHAGTRRFADEGSAWARRGSRLLCHWHVRPRQRRDGRGGHGWEEGEPDSGRLARGRAGAVAGLTAPCSGCLNVHPPSFQAARVSARTQQAPRGTRRTGQRAGPGGSRAHRAGSAGGRRRQVRSSRADGAPGPHGQEAPETRPLLCPPDCKKTIN